MGGDGGDVRNANPDHLEHLASLLWTPPDGGVYGNLAEIITRARSLDASGPCVVLHPLLDWLTDTAADLRDSAGRLRTDDPPPPEQATDMTMVATTSSDTTSFRAATGFRQSTFEASYQPPSDDLWSGPEPVPVPPWLGQEFWSGPEPVPPWLGQEFWSGPEPVPPWLGQEFWSGPEPVPVPPWFDPPDDLWTGPAEPPPWLVPCENEWTNPGWPPREVADV